MKYYILSPAEIVSGGPELAHQMCHEINENGGEAYMYYCYTNVVGPGDAECVDKFKKYNTQHVLSHEEADQNDNIIIVPEGHADAVDTFFNARVILWWMSVDNFFRDNNNTNAGEVAQKVFLNLVQSEYARRFLIDNKISSDKILTVSDYIGDNYGNFIFPAEFRKDRVLFNPKKGYDILKPVIENMIEIEWIPLYKMTEEEMIVMMQSSKIYIDFGNHPGKDRIPREAVSCGCCVITNKCGSAAFYEDVPISDKYKIDTNVDYVEKSTDLINHILNNYEGCMADFVYYRQFVKSEHEKFSADVKSLMETLNR